MQQSEDTDRKVIQLKNEISALSSNLRQLSEQKEAKYKESSTFVKQLDTFIKQANQLKQSKLAVDEEIKKRKTDREKYNKEVSELASKLRELRSNGSIQLPNNQLYSSIIEKRIAELNTHIETEVLQFKKEQALMSQLKELKLALKQALKAEEGIKAAMDLRKQVNDKKKLGDAAHRTVQELAAKNSEIFEQLTEKSLSIAALKKERFGLMEFLSKLKAEIYSRNEELATKLAEWSTYKKTVGERRIHTEASKLIARTKAIRDKLKAKEKLTTEDILLLQREDLRK